MDELETRIRQIKDIRALRVRARKREEAVSASALQSAEQAVREGRHKLGRVERETLTFQRDGLHKLLNDKLVNIDALLVFNAEKLKGIQDTINAKQELGLLNTCKEDALTELTEKNRVTQMAEKRLMAIEEVLENKLWK